MKRGFVRSSLGALACLVVLPSLTAGQSLGDAAKRERERRGKVREAGASVRTLTEEDLATTKGTLANDPKAQPPKVDDGGTSKREGGAAAGGAGAGGAEEGSSKNEERWRRRVAEARARVDEAQRRNDALQRMIRLGQPAQYDRNGQRVMYSIYQLKTMADRAAAELASAQTALENVLEDGRRSGVPPGWLR
jgi:hypothetical protein